MSKEVPFAVLAAVYVVALTLTVLARWRRNDRQRARQLAGTGVLAVAVLLLTGLTGIYRFNPEIVWSEESALAGMAMGSLLQTVLMDSLRRPSSPPARGRRSPGGSPPRSR